MPRTARSIEAGMVYHVLNRGNGRLRLFHNEADYDAFERLLVEGLKRYPVDLLTYCLMPNHWHLVVRPRTDVALGRLMGWVGVTHVGRHHEHDHRSGAGHLYRGRFQSLPVAEDDDSLMLCRYVEANAVRGKLVEGAQQWRWCGLGQRPSQQRPDLQPVARGAPQQEELVSIQFSCRMNRNRLPSFFRKTSESVLDVTKLILHLISSHLVQDQEQAPHDLVGRIAGGDDDPVIGTGPSQGKFGQAPRNPLDCGSGGFLAGLRHTPFAPHRWLGACRLHESWWP